MSDINKLPGGLLYVLGNTRMRLTVTNEETGEVLYTHATDAGVFASVEKHELLKETAEIEGNQQCLMWGHPAVWMHAFSMLHERIATVLEENPDLVKQARAAFETNDNGRDKMSE